MSTDKITAVLRILLVEDNEHDRIAFHRAFRKSKVTCEIREYVRAEEALEQLRSGAQAFDIVVADYKLPGMSGLDLFRRMREEDIRTPFVMLTGSGSEQFAVEALQAGVDDYIIKDSAQAHLRLLPVVLPEVVRRHSDRLEHKKAEEALHLSEEKLRTMFDSMGELMLVTDLQGNITEVNSATLQVLGFANRGKMVGLNCSSFVASRDRDRAVGLWAGALRGGSGQVEEIALLDKRGNEIPVELCAAVLRRKSGNPVGLVGVGRDITERKKAEDELRKSEERYHMLAEVMNDGEFMLNKEGEYTYFNRRFEEITGYPSEDLIGQHFSKVVVPEYLESTIGRFKRGISGEETPLYEIELMRKDGKRIPIELNVKTILDKEGRVTGRLGVARDITERKKAEATRKEIEQKAQVSSRLATVGEMASGVAHEINNPLVSVVGFSQLLMESKDLPDKAREQLKLINAGGMRVASIVERLLSFARQQKPERAYISINDTIEAVVGLRAYEMKAGNIEISTQLDTDLPWTMADAGQLQQVFLNIVMNAEKEMKEAHGRGGLSIKTEAIDKTIRISFKDDGPGIAKENLDRIFNPFFTTREVGEGAGLGLSICHGIIAEHKGRIYAASEPGKGATFIVELPIITEDREQKRAEPVIRESVKAARAKILVVDDEVINLQLISSVLAGEGHEVETVDNAGDALEMIKKGGYDLFLLDIKMPGMSGKELYKVIQDIAPALADRVVFVTGDILGKGTRDFLSKTGAPYINKPFDNEELKRMVNRVLAS